MNKLLHANFSRLKKHKIFWAGVLLVALYAAFACVNTFREMKKYDYSQDLDALFFSFMTLMGIVLSVFCSLFLGTEYSDGTIRNKIAIGRSRYEIYLANFITCTAAGILCYLAGLIVCGALGIPMFGFFETPLPNVLLHLLDGLLLCMSYAAIYNMVSMLSSSKAHTAVICILIGFGLMFLAVFIYSSLSQPEMVEQAAVYIGDAIQLETVENPHYLTGLKREIYSFLFDFLPGGQSLQISGMRVSHPWQMAGYSLIIAVVSNAAGILLFRKKDIK